mgnify:CR=1 FL=1
MAFDLLIECIKNIATIAILAYPLMKVARFRRSLLLNPSPQDKILLSVLMGLFSIIGDLLGVQAFNGALIDSRIVGPVVGGLVAGPAVGFAAGIIGGLHRLAADGFTVVPDLLGNLAGGVIGGLVHSNVNKLSFLYAFAAGACAEAIRQSLILLLAKPFIVAKAFVGMAGLSLTIVNGLGVALFVAFIEDIQSSQHRVGTSYAEKALEIARRSLPILKTGFNSRSARELAEVIFDISGLDAVAVTDKTNVLAYIGAASDHHIVGTPYVTSATRRSIGTVDVLVANSREEIGCPHPNCPLLSAVEAPLTCDGELVGCLKVYKVNDVMHLPDVKMVTGIADLLSLQIESVKHEEQARHLADAEYAVLRAQINPHFLFNALSVIKLLIRTDPKHAQDLIVDLSAFFRYSLKQNADLLPLFKELESIRLYLNLQQARYGDRLQVNINVDDKSVEALFPTFCLQQLVENCMNHGLSNKKGQLLITINAAIANGNLTVSIRDNGVGFPPEVIEAVNANTTTSTMGIGLTNINRRLKTLYGGNYTLRLKNTDQGSEAAITIPND